MKRSVALSLALVAATLGGCSNEEAQAPPAEAPSAAAKTAEESPPKIPVLPGYKYYAGGPILKRDKYGNYRVSGFNGEVQQPPSRGMVFGAKTENDTLEYRVWGNGVLLGVHRGPMREGVMWLEYTESYRGGKLVARERRSYDHDAKKVKAVLEDIDPETGEVIRTRESLLNLHPPKIKAEDGEEEEGAVAEPVQPAPAGSAPATPGAAPAAPSGGDPAPAAPAPGTPGH